MADFWNQCFEPRMKMTPKDFEHTFCRVCRNQECSRSRGSATSWIQRISTQEDRLLLNPKFADPSDPTFSDIRSVDFASAVMEAMRLEVSDRKKDWNVPTEADVVSMASELAPESTQRHPSSPVVTQQHPTAPTGTQEHSQAPASTPKVLQSFSIRGTKGDDYAVTLVEGDRGPEWRCTCLAWVHGRTRPCKHVEYAAGLLEEEEEAPVEVTPEPVVQPPPPTRFQPPQAPPRPQFYPPLGNVPAPQGGVMVDGSPPPRLRVPAAPVDDPWAVPAPKPVVVPVGGKVVLGGKKS